MLNDGLAMFSDGLAMFIDGLAMFSDGLNDVYYVLDQHIASLTA